MQAGSRTTPKSRTFSSNPKQNSVAYRSKQCPTCKVFIAGDQYQQHIDKCLITPKINKVADPKRQTTYSVKNQNNMNRIFIKKDNSAVMQEKYSTSKPISNYLTNNPKQDRNSMNKNDKDLILRRRVSANVNSNKMNNNLQSIGGNTGDTSELEQKKQSIFEQNSVQIQPIKIQATIQQEPEQKKQGESPENLQKKNEQEIEKKQVQVMKQEQKQAILEDKMEYEEGQKQGNKEEYEQQGEKKSPQIRIRVRPSSSKKVVSHQVRMTEIHNDLIRKYNQNPERISWPQKKQQEIEMTTEEKTKWQKEKQRERKRKEKMERDRERERQRQRALERQREIQRQRIQEEERQRKEQEERIRRQQRQQVQQIRRAQNQSNFLSQNINIHPVYNQTVHNLFLLISIANQLIGYIQNYTQNDPVVMDMLSQIRRLNQMVGGLSQHIVSQNSMAITMVNTYARRSQQIQQIIFQQLETVLIANLSQFNDQELLNEIRNTIQTGINNIRALEFPILSVHNLSQTSKFTSKQIQEIFPAKLALADNECSICLEDIRRGTKIKQLQCKHMFHPTCIDQWLMQSRKCPLCRMQQKLQD